MANANANAFDLLDDDDDGDQSQLIAAQQHLQTRAARRARAASTAIDIGDYIAHIKYTITGVDEHGYLFGTTTLSYNGSSWIEDISVVSFGNNAETLASFDLMKECDDKEEFLTALFLHDESRKAPKIIMERIHHTCESWFNKKFEMWSREGTWLSYIEGEIKTIFREVFKCLVLLYKKKLYHGNLKKGIFVSKEGRVQLAMMKKKMNTNDKSVQFQEGMKEDFIHIKEIIVGILRLGQQGDTSYENLNMPFDLREFLDNKPPYNKAGYKDIEWFFDDCYFWTPSEIIDFMMKSWHFLFNERYFNIAEFKKRMNIYESWWEDVLSLDPSNRLRQILENHDGFMQLHDYTIDDAMRVVDGYEDPVELVRFIRNVIVHYNDYSHVKVSLSDEDIYKKLTDLFPDVCYVVRQAVTDCINLGYILGNSKTRQNKLIKDFLTISMDELTTNEKGTVS